MGCAVLRDMRRNHSRKPNSITAKGATMTNDEIIDLYDSNPNLTLAQLAAMTGKSVAELKRILMG